jgi:exodeoxyribonuclease V alpha subunit
MAKKLVNRFGEQVFEVIERRPERLTDVPGLGKALAKRITEAWEEQRAVKDIMLFLQSRGLSRLRADRIFEAYGAKAIETVSKNPYRLARDIRGIGFMAADELAAKLEIAKDSPFRLAAGLRHALEEAMGQGHVGLPRTWLIERAADLLGVPSHLLDPVVDAEVRENRLIADMVGDTGCLFLPEMHAAETDIAKALIARAWQAPPWRVNNIEDTVRSVETALGLELAEEQREALRLAYRSRLLIITGGPGTGKTTLVRAILRGLEKNQLEIMLAAPTGRAARRLGESSGREARTLHRLLEAEPGRGFRRDAERPLEGDLLIVDEMSMVDVPLMQALGNALPDQAALFLVGDVDQLPSIGPGQVLLDLIECGRLPVIRLEKIFRQAEESRIIQNAHRINKREMPDLSRPSDADLVDFYAIRAGSPERAAETLVELVAERIPKTFGIDPLQDIQVLCPTNRGPIGTRTLNEKLQAALNADAVDRIDHRGIAYATGDKVMQIENDYEREVYNGDIGRITAIDHAAKIMTVTIDGNPLAYGFDELDNLVPAYAITVHKAQGSEYPAVVLPLARQQGRMLRRNLVYTAITRAKHLVVLLVEPGAIELAVEQRPEAGRWSRLRDLLSA